MILLARINKGIFQALLKKADKTPQRVYQIIQEKRKEYDYTISRETAANLLAAQMKIDVSKFLGKEELEELRKLKKNGVSLPVQKQIKVVEKAIPESVTIKIGEELITQLSLPKKLAKETKRMAQVYPRLYVLENSLRFLITNTMKKKHGNDWWDSKVPVAIRRNAESRKNHEGRNRWHSRRGSHEIFYTDFGDLSSIIINSWDDFKEVFPSQRWIQARVEDIELSRNIIAHNNPLPEREIKRLELYFEDFRRQLARTSA